MDIMHEVKDGLARWKGHWPVIASESGVYYNTLAKIGRGDHDNPTVETAQGILDVINKLDTDIKYRDRVLLGERK